MLLVSRANRVYGLCATRVETQRALSSEPGAQTTQKYVDAPESMRVAACRSGSDERARSGVSPTGGQG